MRCWNVLAGGFVASIFVGLCAGQTPAPPIGELTNGRRILEKADAAAKAISAVEYDLEAYAGPIQRPDLFKITGHCLLSGKVRGGLPKFRLKGTISPQSKDATEPPPVKELDIGFDSREFSVANATDKTYTATRNTKQLGAVTDMMAIAIAHELCNPAPFSDELKGSVDLVGSEAVSGVDCYALSVLYPEGGATTKFWIGKADFLPRKIVREADEPAGRVMGTTILTNLKLDPQTSDETFRVARPEGYADAQVVTRPGAAPQPAASSPADGGK